MLLACTNRFVVLANVIRQLSNLSDKPVDLVARQIGNLSWRLRIIAWMQLLGVSSFILCAVSMQFLFVGLEGYGKSFFGGSLALLVASLIRSLWEVRISTDAINVEIEQFSRKGTL